MNIINRELVIDAYGEYPSFQDAEILKISLARANYEGMSNRARITIDLSIFSKTIKNVVTIEFNNVYSANIEGFSYQNIIYDMLIKNYDGDMLVTLDSSIGAQVEFRCGEIIFLNLVSELEYEA